jgi:hypothetical protein
MPNWCYNYATLSHEDAAQMDKLRGAIEQGNVLEAFIPTPPEALESDIWYGWRVQNWGTKWDLCDISISKDDGETIGIEFNSAWSPPTKAYDALVEMGFWIDACYSEGGIGFCGRYTQGEDTEYSIDEYSKEWMDANIPREIIETCDLYGYIYDEEEM